SSIYFFCNTYTTLRDLLSFPTRRSSDLVAIFDVRISCGIKVPNARDALESLRSHCASVHTQPAAHFARNSFHPFKSAEICRTRCVSDLSQLYARACGDFASIDFDLLKNATVRMNHHTADAAITDQKIGTAADCKERQVFIAAEPNERSKGILA